VNFELSRTKISRGVPTNFWSLSRCAISFAAQRRLQRVLSAYVLHILFGFVHRTRAEKGFHYYNCTRTNCWRYWTAIYRCEHFGQMIIPKDLWVPCMLAILPTPPILKTLMPCTWQRIRRILFSCMGLMTTVMTNI
jgi:hypothetical protein